MQNMYMKKIINIFGFLLLMTYLFLSISKAQTASDLLPVPKIIRSEITKYVASDGSEKPAVLILWENLEGMYGYKIGITGINGQEDIVDLESAPEGFDEPSAGGWFFDSGVVEGDTYTYEIIIYDRWGEAASTSVKMDIVYPVSPTYTFVPNKNTGNGGLYLSWTKPCNCLGNFEYRVLKGGSEIAKLTDNHYLDASGTMGDSYMILAYKL